MAQRSLCSSADRESSFPFRARNHPVVWTDDGSLDESSLMDTELFACYPLLKCEPWSYVLQRVQGLKASAQRPGVLAVVSTPAIPSYVSSVSQFSLPLFSGRLELPVFSPTLSCPPESTSLGVGGRCMLNSAVSSVTSCFVHFLSW